MVAAGETISVGSVAELLIAIEEIRKGRDWSKLFFRGHADARWQLIPFAGRTGSFDEQALLRAWKRHAAAFLNVAQLTEFELLALAQHHGLKTRLLDWSFNPLAAAYFAVERADERSSPCVIAHYSTANSINLSSGTEEDPFEIEGVRRVRPSASTPRIARQGGIFTIHGPSNLPLRTAEGDRLVCISIPAERSADIRRQLSHIGVNRLALFPDLDGLSGHLNWVSEALQDESRL